MEIRTDRNAVYFSREKVIESIMQEAKILNLHPGAVELYADKVADQVERWAKRRSAITQQDLDRRIAKSLEIYNADLAYVYKNRGKII